jgi:two-component system response regulator FimZ (fimbrial Z protein)
MIKICLADNYPMVHIGVESYFKDHVDISLVANAVDFLIVRNILLSRKIHVLILDLELYGFSGILEIRSILKEFPKIKIIIFSSLSEQIYAPNLLKAGVSGFVHKKEELDFLAIAIAKVYQGEIVLSETFAKHIKLLAKQSKSEQLHPKISKRELQVLRYLSEGKKNYEISKILKLDERTICTFKTRLLKKLNVTNLVDLIKKKNMLEII